MKLRKNSTFLTTTLFLLASSLPVSAASLVFSGTGANAGTEFTAMKAAIGGPNNNPLGPQAEGFRTIDWDAVKLDGTDFGSNTQVIVPNKIVGIPENRFLARGVLFDEFYAVSGDGFESVNPGVVGQFPAFSPKNTFAHFGEKQNEIDLSFTVPGSFTKAATRGFGAIFLDVELPDTSSIEYFSGNKSLGKYFVATANSGEPSFLGVLFDKPLVTRVELNLGNNTIFKLDGNPTSPGPADLPQRGIDLVATDDFLYAEPLAASDIPEPSLGLGLLLCGGLGAASSWRKSKARSA